MINTIVYFHIGRGGRFNNAGHTTFCGRKDIEQVLQSADESGKWNFIVCENEYEIAKKNRRERKSNDFV